MTRNDYITQLQKYLKRLPAEDYQDAMEHFNEYFDEAGLENEAQVIAELGSPKQAAREILNQLYDKKTEMGTATAKNTILIVILSILAAPLAFPLALTLLALFLTAIILVFSFLLVLASIWISAIALGIGFIFTAFQVLSIAWSSSLLFIGLGLAAITLGLLGTQMTIILGKKTVLALIHLMQEKVIRRNRYEII
ncbi:DUF1700 domain-containing protein [Streptococcus sp. zg-86]|uniref:DUF1700 domain-containing protein n=1 Tax=Streptococcus zhangguiae TaxID=2664091 RepID=A0A6I4RBF3_9STRE|nr:MULTISPECIES: DUF1700 domain-containing protein [unclassified Streptococcus]MTB64030.1 DUF1700 domain-containing protein [Streptococcus sp. zg-86]MTB90340.1 DUF1700 domain-containing protein [Streptococcus sp. zg-36]MWV56018.1 DUF1700 domain-containing protein [Streptococcus sp. zg-70]QTH47056.1 DUF1700 domain-containing protein [Streptococcus sp. zg-86]